MPKLCLSFLQVLGTKSFGWQGNGGAAKEGGDNEDAAAEGASEEQQQQQQEPEINDDEAPTAGDIEVRSAASIHRPVAITTHSSSGLQLLLYVFIVCFSVVVNVVASVGWAAQMGLRGMAAGS
jgi:hypothetical protein